MKFQYPITIDYVRNWSIRDALRELISNGLDGQTVSGERFEARHDPKKDILYLTNFNTVVDAQALYLGGTSKIDDKRLIGQYGEGLKLAMLVCARTGVKLVIRNGPEVWAPAIEPDKLGTRVLTVNIRKGSETNADFQVEVHGVNSDAWHILQDSFMALRTPSGRQVTKAGEVISDPEYVGKIFVKGVYCCTRPNYSTGYNFQDLDIGRDRRIPSSYDMDYQISRMWEELATQDKGRFYKLLRQDSAEADALRWTTTPALSKGLVEEFKEEFGEDAYPVSSVAEASELEHLGKNGVMLSSALATILKKEMPTKLDIQEKLKKEVVRVVQLQELTPGERKVLTKALALAPAEASACTTIVEFRDPSLRGLHTAGKIEIARTELKSVGDFLITLFHEYAHEFGHDGEASHIEQLQTFCAQAINELTKEKTDAD